LEKNRKIVAERVKKFEEAAEEIRHLTDTLHRKMEQLHLDSVEIRKHTRAARNGSQRSPRPQD